MPVTPEHAVADAAEAHLLLESRTSTGKIVLRPDGAVGLRSTLAWIASRSSRFRSSREPALPAAVPRAGRSSSSS
jgi:hypothetical protein